MHISAGKIPRFVSRISKLIQKALKYSFINNLDPTMDYDRIIQTTLFPLESVMYEKTQETCAFCVSKIKQASWYRLIVYARKEPTIFDNITILYLVTSFVLS